MRPSVKYGLIGGVVSLLIMFSGTFVLIDKPSLYKAFQYLLQLAIIISIVAAIKQTRDKIGGIIELKDGMKSGLGTVLIICVFLGAYNFIFQATISKDELLKQSNESLKAYYVANPVKDTGAVSFKKAVFTADSSAKAENYGYARFMLEHARNIDSTETSLSGKIKDTDDKMIALLTAPGYQLKRIFQQLVFFQLIIGMLIAFVTTMIFRYKQQNEM